MNHRPGRLLFVAPIAVVLVLWISPAVSPAPAGAASAAADAAASGLVVHEWGTFLSVQGSDGVSVGGVVESEELLPEFVLWHGDANAQWRTLIRQKMETPVTYFYTDRPLDVRVRVDMPQGLLTHWFPAVRAFGNLKAAADDPRKLVPAAYEPGVMGTFLDWGRFRILPDPGPQEGAAIALPAVESGNSWRFSRQTDSALVKIHAGDRRNLSKFVHEKFLFYRGLGAFELPLTVRSSGVGDDLRLQFENSEPNAPLTGLFLVEVEGGRLRFGSLGRLAPAEVATKRVAGIASRWFGLDEGVERVKGAVADFLVSAGLYRKEALAMVNTWEASYFRSEGLRLLYALPRSTVDATIPIRITPEPADLVRVMLARVEVLTPRREQELATSIAALGAPDTETRRLARAKLERLGRLFEPAVRRILAATGDAATRALAESLLAELAAAPSRKSG